MILVTIAICIFLFIVGGGAFIALVEYTGGQRKARLRREEAAEREAKRLAAEAERAEAQKPYNEKCLAWIKARLNEGPPKQTYGEFGRLWGYPIDTQEEYDVFRQSAYANAIELQPSRRSGAYEILQQIQNAYAQPYRDNLSHGSPFLYNRVACPRCYLPRTQIVGGVNICPRCGT